MVVLEIDVDGIIAIPTEGDPPVAAGIDRERASAVAAQGVETITWQVEFLGAFAISSAFRMREPAAFGTLSLRASPVSANGAAPCS
jgi:hypothetical protein